MITHAFMDETTGVTECSNNITSLSIVAHFSIYLLIHSFLYLKYVYGHPTYTKLWATPNQELKQCKSQTKMVKTLSI